MPPYVAQVRDKLVTPPGAGRVRAGDNDAPKGDEEWHKAARICWQMIAGMSAPLTKPSGAKAWEGVKEDCPGCSWRRWIMMPWPSPSWAHSTGSGNPFSVRRLLGSGCAGARPCSGGDHSVVQDALLRHPEAAPRHGGRPGIFRTSALLRAHLPTGDPHHAARPHPARAGASARVVSGGDDQAGQGVVYVVTGGGGRGCAHLPTSRSRPRHRPSRRHTSGGPWRGEQS